MSTDAIIVGDVHLREDQPEAWTESYWEAQVKTMKWLRGLQRHYHCPVLCPGDLFDKWNPSLYLTSWAYRNLPDMMIVTPGQHDLPQHRLDRIQKSVLHLLLNTGKIQLILNEGMDMGHDSIQGYPWGSEMVSPVGVGQGARIALCHVMTYNRDLPYPGCSADPSTKLMKKLPDFDLIVTGDNHQAFTMEFNGRLLVNGGSLLPMNAGQLDHKPRVYLWNKSKGEVTPEYIPEEIYKGKLTRDHIESQDTRDARIEAFVKRLRKDVEIGLSFQKNLEEFFRKNKTRETIKQIIREVV